MTENYQNWVDRVVGGREAKPLSAGEVVKSSAGQNFGAVEFVKIQKKGFIVEVGKKGDVYIYHFYPDDKYMGRIIDFFDPMSESFVQTFQRPEQVEAAWEEQMKAYAVRVMGFVNTIWGDDLAIRVLDVLEGKLEERQ